MNRRNDEMEQILGAIQAEPSIPKEDVLVGMLCDIASSLRVIADVLDSAWDDFQADKAKEEDQ